MKSAILAIRIIGDATSAVAAMDKAQRASMSFKDKVGKASVAASAALAAIGAVLYCIAYPRVHRRGCRDLCQGRRRLATVGWRRRNRVR